MNQWFIPDAYYPSSKNGAYVSHEAVCFLNPGKQDASVTLTLYFEDREKMEGFSAVVPAERTVHLRMDKIVSASGQSVPMDTPYAMMIESEQPLHLQYTRVDTTQAELAIATTIVKG